MYKKGAGNDKQGKDAGNRTPCPYRNFSQAISSFIDGFAFPLEWYLFQSRSILTSYCQLDKVYGSETGLVIGKLFCLYCFTLLILSVTGQT